jgi:outer membrane protein assembly factor BamB
MLITSTIAALMAVTFANADDWPNWRGPNHDGISLESTFVCVAGKAYTCGTQDKQQVLFCLNADTGDVIWQKPFEKEYRERQGGDGTRGTPAVADGRVYLQSARGRLICFDAGSGEEVWSRRFKAMPQWGYSGSVLIEGNLAIAIAGNEDGPLVALDKQTGKTVWKRGRAPVGYSTPYAFTLKGRRYVVGFLGGAVIIADVETGREVWSMPWKTSYDVNAATPIFHDGRLFVTSGYKHGSALVKLTPAGDRLAGEIVWESKAIRAKFQSPVLYKGHLYTSDEVGFKIVEFATGELKWSQRGMKFGTVALADGHLFVLTESGELLIGEAKPSGFEPVTRVSVLKGRCWTVPTLYKGRLYARNLKQAVCLELSRRP